MSVLTRPPTLVLVALMALTGCEQESSNPKIVLGQKPSDCSLTLEGMSGKTYVLEKILPDKSTQPDPQTRLKIEKDGDAFTAKYNVSSLSDMYDYKCSVKADELICHEEVGEKLPDICKALLAGGAECSAAALKKLVPQADEDEIAAAVKEANETADKYRDKPEWERFVFANNNLGNKLMGILYVQVDTRRCKPRITDNYMTIYEGKKVEDSNPVGTNHFVESEKTLFWDHCTDSQNLVAIQEAELPRDLSKVGTQLNWEVGKDVHYHHVVEGDDGKAVDGCTYSFDFWLKWEPLEKGVTAEVVDGRVQWHLAHTYTEPGNYVTHMVRSKTCEGKEEALGVSCNLVQVK